ncbi:MAG TPA: alginate lyase family protein [Saprospiraceae bacterium]|nr:alginate lyase family protein [Saprospiraceae bacterium]
MNNGLLWNYQLNYFDLLKQTEISIDQKISLLENHCQQLQSNTFGLDAYPTSLRLMNSIQFFIHNRIDNINLQKSLFQQSKLLENIIEYHLCGNHLLENGFALYWSGIYFNDSRQMQLGKSLLMDELNEQLLADGGHFELSPQYHCIILERILDLIQLLSKNNLDSEFLNGLLSYSSRMLSWLEAIRFTNGELPLVGDSTIQCSEKANALNEYAKQLKIPIHSIQLKESSYRMFRNNKYDCLVDVGKIGPDYIPGHAHADSLSFIISNKNKQVFCDTGISTYEKNEQRQYERSTAAHNTVVIKDQNSSEVWGGFRVGNRAKARIHLETKDEIIASHDGYRKYKITHKRRFQFYPCSVVIHDSVSHPSQRLEQAKAYFHINSEIKPSLINNQWIHPEFIISFSTKETVKIVSAPHADDYNKVIDQFAFVVHFEGQLKTVITLL